MTSLTKLGSGDDNSVQIAAATMEKLLQTRRDLASVEEAKSWTLPLFALSHKSEPNSSGLSDTLTQAAFSQVAIEAIVSRYQIKGEAFPEEVTCSLKKVNFNAALSAIRDAIGSSEAPRNDLATLYIEVMPPREGSPSTK